MKVLLISANTERINLTPMPLGLNCVAAATRRGGHDVRVLDLMAENDSGLPIREAILSFHPGVIGISVRNIDDQNRQGRFLLDEVKRVVRSYRDLCHPRQPAHRPADGRPERTGTTGAAV